MTQALLRPTTSGCVAARVRGPSSLTFSAKVSLPGSAGFVTTTRFASRRRPVAVSGRRGGSIVISSAVDEQQERHERHGEVDEDGVAITEGRANQLLYAPRQMFVVLVSATHTAAFLKDGGGIGVCNLDATLPRPDGSDAERNARGRADAAVPRRAASAPLVGRLRPAANR